MMEQLEQLNEIGALWHEVAEHLPVRMVMQLASRPGVRRQRRRVVEIAGFRDAWGEPMHRLRLRVNNLETYVLTLNGRPRPLVTHIDWAAHDRDTLQLQLASESIIRHWADGLWVQVTLDRWAMQWGAAPGTTPCSAVAHGGGQGPRPGRCPTSFAAP